MHNAARTILIATGVAILVLVVFPLLFMIGMMFSSAGSMGGMMTGTGGGWMMTLGTLILLGLGITLIVTGLRREEK